MAVNQNVAQSTQNERDSKVVDAARDNINQTAQHGSQVVDFTRDSVSKMADLRDQTTKNKKQIVKKSAETAHRQAGEATDRSPKTRGFPGKDSERLARQSKQNMEAVTRCGMVLTQ